MALTTEGVAMGVQLNTKHNIILFRTFYHVRYV